MLLEETFSHVMICFKRTNYALYFDGIYIVISLSSSVNNVSTFCSLYLLQISCILFYGISAFFLDSVWVMPEMVVVSVLPEEEDVLHSVAWCSPLPCASYKFSGLAELVLLPG